MTLRGRLSLLRQFLLLLFLGLAPLSISELEAASNCAVILSRVQDSGVLTDDELTHILGLRGQEPRSGKQLTDQAYEILLKLQDSPRALSDPWWQRMLNPLRPQGFDRFLMAAQLRTHFDNEVQFRERTYDETRSQVFGFLNEYANQQTILSIEFLLRDLPPKMTIQKRLGTQYTPALRSIFEQFKSRVQPRYRYHGARAFAEYFEVSESQMREFLEIWGHQ